MMIMKYSVGMATEKSYHGLFKSTILEIFWIDSGKRR